MQCGRRHGAAPWHGDIGALRGGRPCRLMPPRPSAPRLGTASSGTGRGAPSLLVSHARGEGKENHLFTRARPGRMETARSACISIKVELYFGQRFSLPSPPSIARTVGTDPSHAARRCRPSPGHNFVCPNSGSLPRPTWLRFPEVPALRYLHAATPPFPSPPAHARRYCGAAEPLPPLGQTERGTGSSLSQQGPKPSRTLPSPLLRPCTPLQQDPRPSQGQGMYVEAGADFGRGWQWVSLGTFPPPDKEMIEVKMKKTPRPSTPSCSMAMRWEGKKQPLILSAPVKHTHPAGIIGPLFLGQS